MQGDIELTVVPLGIAGRNVPSNVPARSSLLAWSEIKLGSCFTPTQLNFRIKKQKLYGMTSCEITSYEINSYEITSCEMIFSIL